MQTVTGLSVLLFPWDPGASAFLVTPLFNDSSNDTTGNEQVGRLISSTKVFNEVMLDTPPTKPPERYGSADSSLHGIPLELLRTENSLAHTHFNLMSCNSKKFSAVQAVHGACFLLEAIPSWQRGVFSLRNFAISVFWCTVTPDGDNGHTAAKSQNLLPCISTSVAEKICIFVKLLPWSTLLAQHF